MNIYFFIIKLFSPFFLNIHISWFSDFLHVISQQMCCLYFKKRYTCIYPHQHFTGHQRVSPALGFTQLSLPESQWMKVWRVRQSKRVREGGKGYARRSGLLAGGLRWGWGGCCGVPKWEIKVNSHHHKILLSNQLLFGPRLLRCGFKFLPCCVSGLFEGVALVSHEGEEWERRCLWGGVATGLRSEAPVAWLCLYSSHKLPAKLPDKLRWLSESDWAAEREGESRRGVELAKDDFSAYYCLSMGVCAPGKLPMQFN